MARRNSLLHLFLLFLFYGCSDEVISPETTPLPTAEAPKNFSLAKFADTVVRENLIVSWNNYEVLKEEDDEYLIFNASLAKEQQFINSHFAT